MFSQLAELGGNLFIWGHTHSASLSFLSFKWNLVCTLAGPLLDVSSGNSIPSTSSEEGLGGKNLSEFLNPIPEIKPGSRTRGGLECHPKPVRLYFLSLIHVFSALLTYSSPTVFAAQFSQWNRVIATTPKSACTKPATQRESDPLLSLKCSAPPWTSL